FFQAEDGIRDFHVTGVQTCALPISSSEDERCGSRAGFARPFRVGYTRAMAEGSLLSLLLARRVVVIAGAGGVGKTTVAAALALSAAEQGRRVLCLTIDPAKRLFDRLGLDAASGAEQRVDPERFRAAGMTLTGELTLVMLDTKGTFDELVRRYASSPEAARRILDNEFYHYEIGRAHV